MSKRLAVTDNIALAFGFSWQELDPVESKASKLGELLGQGNKWQASFRRAGTDYLGVSKDDFRPLPKIKTLSGAALMANHPDLAGKTVWIVMEEPIQVQAEEGEEPEAGKGPATSIDAQQSEIVVVGLVNGNIVVDDYVDKNGYQQHRSAFLDRCKKAKATYVTVGTSYTLGSVHQVYNWNHFLPSKHNKAVPVKTLEPGIHGRVLLIAAAVAGCFGLVWAYQTWDAAQKEKAEQERRAQAARNIPALYTEAVSQILAQPVIRANSAFFELRSKLAGIPTRLAGWQIGKIKCQATTATCIATWTNENGFGTNRGFANAVPKEWGEITFDLSGKAATHALPFKLTTVPLPARDTWPTQKEFLLKQYSEWQTYWIVKFHPELSPAPSIVGKVPGLDDRDAAGLPNATWAINWSIKDTHWDLSDGFDKTAEKGDANLPDCVTVNEVTIKFTEDKQIKFDAEGVVYERI